MAVVAFLAFLIAELKHMGVCFCKHKGVNVANKSLRKEGLPEQPQASYDQLLGLLSSQLPESEEPPCF